MRTAGHITALRTPGPDSNVAARADQDLTTVPDGRLPTQVRGDTRIVGQLIAPLKWGNHKIAGWGNSVTPLGGFLGR